MKKKELFFWGAATIATLGGVLLAMPVLEGTIAVVKRALQRNNPQYSKAEDLETSMVLDCEMPALAVETIRDLTVATIPTKRLPHRQFMDLPPATPTV